jgi:glycosyltransferase involved in cell wall biosynthesis
MISIIIPTYNEEKYLLKLLESIKKQTYKEYELIVADNDSKDNTKKIAKKYGCKIIKGGYPGKARNLGANNAKYNLLFIDADVVLQDKNILKIFLRRAKKFDIATCKIKPISGNFFHKAYYFFKNYSNKYLWINKKHVSGQFLFVKKKIFEKVKGYDESLYLAEEHDLAERIYKKGGKIGFFMDLYVLNSVRRITKEGFLKQTFKTLYSEFHRAFIGKIRKKILEYEFGNY